MISFNVSSFIAKKDSTLGFELWEFQLSKTPNWVWKEVRFLFYKLLVQFKHTCKL